MYVDPVIMPTAVLDGKRYLEGTNVLFPFVGTPVAMGFAHGLTCVRVLRVKQLHHAVPNLFSSVVSDV